MAALAKARRASERQVVEDLLLGLPVGAVGVSEKPVNRKYDGPPAPRVGSPKAARKASAKKGRAEAEALVERARPKIDTGRAIAGGSDTVRRTEVPKPGWKK